MNMKAFWALGLSVFLLGTDVAAAGEEAILTTLDWPPYTAETLPQQGVSSAIITAAFAAMGVKVTYVFLPWQRAIDAARHGQSDGFFPAYARRANPQWTVSDAIGSGPLYFVERKNAPVRWKSLDDLAHLSIGVNAGFVNTTEIDARLADGRLHGDVGFSDTQNLRKLASGRVDLALIDGNVFRFESMDPDLAPVTSTLRLEDKPLENKPLYVDFRDTVRGRRLRDLLNQGLARIRASNPAEIAALQDRAMAP
jgi:polar amino acid transport system substrate-binding protein